MDVIYRHFQQADRAVRGFELLADVAKPAITSLEKLARSAQSPETVVRAVRALQASESTLSLLSAGWLQALTQRLRQ
jgi:hypothetical protein